jgi:hypothetical protein
MRAVLFAFALFVVPAHAIAHPAPFSFLDLRLGPDQLEGTLTIHDFDVAHDLGIAAPESLHAQSVAESYRDQLSRLMASRLRLTFDGSTQALQWTGIEALPDRQSVRLAFRVDRERAGLVRVDGVLFPYDPLHQTFVNVYEDGGLRHQAIMDGGRATAEYYSGTWQGAAAVMAVFIPSGIEHILIGPDHVLFLIGLLLPGGSLWRLATIVTAFTVGHSITLSLAALDVLSPPAAIIEPAIALSIVFVGADNLLVQHDANVLAQQADNEPAPRRARDIRPLVAAAFGLVHGFGFASVLKEFGLPLTALGWSLLSFNLGVELGQLAIVLIVAYALAVIRRRNATLGRRLVVAGSLVVMLAGGYWFVERVFLNPGA